MLIAQLTDLHVRPRGRPAYRVVETNMLTERAFQAVARLKPRPDAVVLSGDLTDCGLPEEYELLGQMIERHLEMPTYLVPGNHDRREAMKAALGHLPGIEEDPVFIHYVIDDFPVRLVMLDSVVPGTGHGELCAERLVFLERTLTARPETPTVVVLHHPPFVCGIGHMDRINLRNADALAAVLGHHPQVGLVLCGHHHRPITTRFAHALASTAPSVAHQVELALTPGAPSAFCFEPPAFQLHLWTPESGFVSHTAYVDSYPGPYPFILDRDYPGAAGEAEPSRSVSRPAPALAKLR